MCYPVRSGRSEKRGRSTKSSGLRCAAGRRVRTTGCGWASSYLVPTHWPVAARATLRTFPTAHDSIGPMSTSGTAISVTVLGCRPRSTTRIPHPCPAIASVAPCNDSHLVRARPAHKAALAAAATCGTVPAHARNRRTPSLSLKPRTHGQRETLGGAAQLGRAPAAPPVGTSDSSGPGSR